MSMEHRIKEAVQTHTEAASAPPVDVSAIREQARRQARGRRTAAVAAAVAAVAVAVTGAMVTGRDTSPPPSPAGPVSPSISEQPSTSLQPALPTGSWETYRSTRYDFRVGRPPTWTEEPATRDWSWESDVEDHLSPAHEAFLSRDGHVRLSVWNAPLDPSTREESLAYLVSWVEDYCQESGNSPCTGIAGRAVELCLERRDCHPGLLVPFENDVQAFFSGGIYAQDAMTVVAVWRGESSPFVARYGGSRRLLEAFLSTMDVWPSTTPLSDRR
jgi:hypothetical protein